MSTKETPIRESAGGLADYFRATRGPWYGFLFAMPVLLCYEAFEAVQMRFGGRLVNAADAILTRWLQIFGPEVRFYTFLVVLVVSGLVCRQLDAARRQGAGAAFQPQYFLGMLAESVVYAIFFGGVVNRIMTVVIPGGGLLQAGPDGAGLFGRLTMALGAGIYEELLFRVLLMGGLILAFRKTCHLDGVPAWVLAALASSLVFSAFHYIGAYGDPFTLSSFVFRAIAGGLLATVYACRGFGVAVWTHALYDIIVLLLLPLLT